MVSEKKAQIRVGQVYREKDKRFERYVRIYATDTKWRKPAWWVWPCDATGKSAKDYDKGKNDRRTSLIAVTTLNKRFELIKDVEASL